MLQERH